LLVMGVRYEGVGFGRAGCLGVRFDLFRPYIRVSG